MGIICRCGFCGLARSIAAAAAAAAAAARRSIISTPRCSPARVLARRGAGPHALVAAASLPPGRGIVSLDARRVGAHTDLQARRNADADGGGRGRLRIRAAPVLLPTCHFAEAALTVALL
eukprot:scaffold1809_cov386-Prasinococcus_capsulatus_cf.AAC.60